MKKIKKIIGTSLSVMAAFSFTACDDFMDLTPNDSVTDAVVWSDPKTVQLFVNEVYNQTLTGPLYDLSSGCADWWSFDHAFTDDMASARGSLNEMSFTPSSLDALIRNRWADCYTNIRRANIGLENLESAAVLEESQKDRYMGDMYFLRGILYLELWRFWGGVPLIDHALNKNSGEDIYYPRSTSEETLEFIIEDLKAAEARLPLKTEMSSDEYGRATKGAAVGMKVIALLHAAGTIDRKYYELAATESERFISGDLQGQYALFGTEISDPDKKAETFANLFLEPYEGSTGRNPEVIFDVQYANPYRTQRGYQSIVAPGYPGKGSDYGWGYSSPSQMLVDAFEMKDGSTFDWNNPEHAAAPYENRDARFYASILYDGVVWKDTVLSLSSNRYIMSDRGRWENVKDNLPNGLFSSKTERTKTGYFIRKHQNEEVKCGTANRYNNMEGEGGNFIVLRFAEILLSYAEAMNEVSGPTPEVYEAINKVRDRAGQPSLPGGLGQDDMRERIWNERRVELAFENKRYFDIIRWKEWKAGERFLNQPFYGMNVHYVLENGEPVRKYEKFVYVQKIFNPNKNYLLPIPQSVMNKNPKIAGHNNPGW